ncbi:ankyrin repeat domain 49 isoform X1 [Pelobates cultripes]|uniref:Ankyrin repeat domain 49 isoform X1 n=1 Tax=Pelobates cultripes TaxID=61616 RepID=A0AAD1T8R2_PELCU|nr:ankyrin repeat domain 49 isoform X1 [Pelobates cultripes]
MPRSKEISEHLRNAVIAAHQSKKGYKTIAKTLGLHLSTVRAIVYKWRRFNTTATLPRSGRPAKMSQKAIQQILINEVTNNHRVSSEDTQDQNMPKCIVRDCPHKTGRKLECPTVVLHAFPNNLEKIKQWLLQTRQDFGDLETFAIEVLEGKKSEKHCLCSEHFTSDCYIYQGSKVVLSRDAIPTIFPGGEKSGTTEECEVGPPRKKYRSGTPECSIFIDALGVPSHTGHEDASTQTDPHFGHKDVGTKTSATLGKKHASTQTKGI